MNTNTTATQLLDAAQGLVQAKGFNAFSYNDLSEAVGIRKASIHYHYKSKADLGVALMQRYLDGLREQLAKIDTRVSATQSHPTRKKLRAFIQLYKDTEKSGAICLCGSLASDSETLSDEVRLLVSEYLKSSEDWLEKTIRSGIKSEEFQLSSKAREAAANLLAGLQGGLILSRVSGGKKAIKAIESSFLSQLQ